MVKKILFIAHTDNLRGGGEISLIELIKTAIQKGYETFVVTPGEGDFSEQAQRIGAHTFSTMYHYWGREYSVVEDLNNFQAVKEISAFIQTNKIDVVVSNTLTVPWGAFAAALTNRPHMWLAREYLANHHSLLERYYPVVGNLSNVVMANSQHNAQYMEKKGIKKVKYFHSFVDTAGISLSKRSTQQIVCIGRIHEDKNQLELLEAVAVLPFVIRQSLKVSLIGGFNEKDPYYSALVEFIEKNQLEEVVELTGHTTKPYGLVGPNDILVQPSKSESLGRVITEGMKLGLICVGANIPGTAEAFKLGGGVLYELGKPNQLSHLLKDIYLNYSKYKKDAARAKKRSLKNLSEVESHSPVFSNLDAILSEQNPLPGFDFLLSPINTANQTMVNQKTTIERYMAIINEQKKRIAEIEQSKAWRLILKGKRLIGRQR